MAICDQVVRRGFGFTQDIFGGTDFDALPPGSGAPFLKDIPDATEFWPVTGGTLDKNIERIDRNDEVRGRRANTAPIPFRAGPQITIPCRAYRKVIETALFYLMGTDDIVTGVASPYSHAVNPAPYGSVCLPALNWTLIRDDLYYKMSGGTFNRVTLNFPLDGEGTVEMEVWGLYHQLDDGVAPTATYGTDFDDVLMLRDAAAFIDGSSTAIPDLQGIELTFTNNLIRKFYAGRDIAVQTVGSNIVTSPAENLQRTRKLWFPTLNKLGAAQDVTLALTFGQTNTAQEMAGDFAQMERIVFNIEGGPIPGGVEMVEITSWNTVWTGGGAGDLTARDEITSRFEGGAFYSETQTKDVSIEIINGSATPITNVP